MPPMKMTHDIDPVQEIRDAVGDISNLELFNMQVLVGIYIRPQKTKSGIILTDRTVDEDKYQGKVGVVLKAGPSAFVDETGKWFNGNTISVGDWVVFRPSDGWAIAVNGYSCRILDDLSIKARIDQPDMIW